MPESGDIAYSRHSGGASAAGRPPLILIHGAGGNRLFWPARLRRLAAATVYALDLPGHGQSPGAGRSTVEGYADAVVEWMRRVEIGRAIFAGHSMGGAVGLTLALLYPERVAGLALVASGGRLRVHPAILEQTAEPATIRQAIDLVVEWSFSSAANRRLVELAGKRMLASGGDVLHADFVACDGFDVLARLGEVCCPTLVLCGSEDRMAPPRYAHALAEGIQPARLELIDGAGHMVMLERPEAVAEALTRFLGEIFPND